jgi:tetratricopeptide (TPR) repeat protein
MGDVSAGLALEREGEWERAAALYRQLLAHTEEQSERSLLLLRLGTCLFEASDFDASEEALTDSVKIAEAIDNKPTLGEALLLQGLIELEQGLHRRALDRLTKAHALLGDSPKVVLALSTAMRERGELQAALNGLLELRERALKPHELAELLDELGAVHLARGDFRSAEQVLREALELDDRIATDYQTASSKLLLAQAILGQGRRKESRRLIDEAAESYDETDRGLSKVYLCLGDWYQDGSDYIGAAKQYRHARDIDQESDDVVGQARALRKLARIHRLRGDRDLAQDALENAGRLLVGLDNDLEWAALYTEQGYMYIADVDYDEAIDRFEKARAVAEADGEERAIAVAKRGLAIAVWRDGQLEKAKSLLEEAAPVLETRGDLRELNTVLDDLGEVLIDLNCYDEALSCLERSAELDQQLGTVASKARTLLLMGRCHLRRGDRREAGERLQQALDVYRESEDDEGKANAFFQLGQWSAEEGHLGEALDRFKEALRIDSRQEDWVGIARAQRGIASIHRQRGELDQAEEALQSAQAELRHKEDPMEEALLATELARLAIERGAWREAEAHLKEASGVFDDMHSPVQRAISDRLLASVYAADPKSRARALELLKDAEAVFLEKHDFPELDDLYDDLALCYLAMRRPDDAMAAVVKSLDVGRKMGWDRGNGRSNLIMARINMRLGKMRDARQDLADAVECYERAEDEIGQTEAYLLLGDWFVANDQLDEAIKTYKRSRRIDRWHGDLRGISKALRKLGEVYFIRGDFSRAEEAFDEAKDYLRTLNVPEEHGLLALARGRLYAAQGGHERAVHEFTTALGEFDTLMMEEERTRTYRELSASHHALGEFDLAMECMRKMGLEQAALWGSLLDNFDDNLRSVCQQAYLRGDYKSAVTGAFAAFEQALRSRADTLSGVGARANASELAEAWYRPDARGTGELDEKNLAQLRSFAIAGFNLFRNPVLHKEVSLNGLQAFVALAVAQYLYTSLDA